jgi:hypothetical protein
MVFVKIESDQVAEIKEGENKTKNKRMNKKEKRIKETTGPSHGSKKK